MAGPLGEVGHHLRGEQFVGLDVVPIVAVDQQLDAGVLIAADQVDGLRHGADKAPQWPAAGEPLALGRHAGRVAGDEPAVFSIEA